MSAYGLNGGPSRCYPFWQELLQCYIINTADGPEGKWKCVPQVDDYYECLHHRKEIAKVRAMKQQYLKWERDHPLDPELKKRLQKEGVVKGLGLLEKPITKKAIGSLAVE